MEPNFSNSWIFLDGYFEIILLPFFLDIFNSTLSALGAATFPNSIPVQCIKNFLIQQ